MFLCDVPLFVKQTSADGNSNNNIVRLMGTVVDIIHTSPSPSSDTRTIQSTSQTPSIANNSTHPTRLIHFVIDDGTESIGVFTKRRVENNNSDCISGASFGQSLPTTYQNGKIPPVASKNMKQNQYLQTANQTLATVTLESILTSPPPPILLGQTVDCIGKIQVDNGEKLGVDDTNNDNKKVPRIWLAASSVSPVNNPQTVTLRQIELSSRKRLKRSPDDNNGRGRRVGGSINPLNRILVGGLESKLNPLFHCNTQGSVVFNMEDAFNYIKHSKDDGGITPQELALLVGAIEPNETLAVNLAVEQLREDSRIYLNQGKWFPM